MQGKVCLITGGNSGIGKATATELARKGATVVLLCRSRERGEAAAAEIRTATGNANVEVLLCDLASQRSVREAAAEFKRRHDRLHVLVNNAAVFLPKRSLTEDGIETTFATNYLGHFLLTHLLLDTLKTSAPARIVNVASQHQGVRIDFDDLMLERRKYSIFAAVGPTKLGLVMFTRALAKRLEGTGVTVNSLHPGLVKTGLLDDSPALMRVLFHLISTTPEKGARTPVYLATAPELAGVSGKYFSDMKEARPTGQANDEPAIERLYEVSLRLAKLPESAPVGPLRSAT